MNQNLLRIRSVADYQFGRGIGSKLFPQNVQMTFSKRTGRIRYLYLDGRRLATMRPTDGLFSLSLEGAQRLVSSKVPAKCFVIVKEDVSSFVAEGGDVFAVHVLKADEDIRSKDEIIAIDRKKKILGVGRSVLSGNEMQAFRRGVAVKIRRGFSERLSKV